MVTDTPAVPASPAPVPDAVRQVDNIDDQFFALIYSDEELLRDEFDALMAAAWSSPPPTPACRRDAERPPDRPRPDLPPTLGGRRDGVLTRVRDSRARTRSPPDSTGRGHRTFITAGYHAGVLSLDIPVAETAKPRKITVNSNGQDRQAINA